MTSPPNLPTHELKPCPFCKADARVSFRTETQSVSWADGLGSPGVMVHAYHGVCCTKCGASIESLNESPDQVAEKWNSRAVSTEGAATEHTCGGSQRVLIAHGQNPENFDLVEVDCPGCAACTPAPSQAREALEAVEQLLRDYRDVPDVSDADGQAVMERAARGIATLRALSLMPAADAGKDREAPRHEQRVVGHVSGRQEHMPTCVCGQPWPCALAARSSLATLTQALEDSVRERESLRGDLNIARLERDAKLCSECPRIPAYEALRKDALRWYYCRDNACGAEVIGHGEKLVHIHFPARVQRVGFSPDLFREAIDAAMVPHE